MTSRLTTINSVRSSDRLPKNSVKETPLKKQNTNLYYDTDVTTTAKTEANLNLQHETSQQQHYSTSNLVKKSEASREDKTTCLPIGGASTSTEKKHFFNLGYRKNTMPSTSSRDQLVMSDRGLGKKKLKIISAMAETSVVQDRPSAFVKYSLSDLADFSLRGSGSNPPASKVFSILHDVKSMLGRSHR
jgi:hypothetical protein